MAESNVIREFLVALGFKSDEAALQKFTSGIEKATKTVFGLAAAIETTAVAVSAGVARFASNLESLYFASIRTGSSATKIEALGRAAQNFGARAGEAQGSLEGLARFLRQNPAGEGFLNSLGVHTRAHGKLRDLSDVMVDLGKRFAQMPMYLSSQYASMLGISDNTMLALRNGSFATEYERMKRQMPDFGKTAKDAHTFMESLRDLEIQLQAFGLRVQDVLQRRLGLSVRGFVEYLKKNGPELANKLIDVINVLWNAAQRLVPAFKWAYGEFVNLDKATGGWSTKILLLAAALKFMGGAQILGGLFGLTAAFVRLGAGITGVAASLALLAVPAGIGLGALIDKIFPNNWLAKSGQFIGGKLYQYQHHGAETIEALTNYGWTRAQAAGIVANLAAESNLDPGVTGDSGRAYGIAQWHRGGRNRFKAWAGHDIRGSSFKDQLGFLNFDTRHGDERRMLHLLSAAKNADQAARIFSLQYERPRGGAVEAARRGALAVHLAQETTIHVHGADAKATAKAVADNQRGVNADLVRTFSSAVQ